MQSLDEETRNEILVKLLPVLRGKVSQANRFIGTVHVTESVLQFVNSVDAPRLAEIGTSCPDHFLRTKIKPLYVDWDPQEESYEALLEKLEKGLVAYRADYAAYYEACKHPNSPAMRDPNPTVILIPGLGLIAWGKNKSESRVTAEFYSLAIEVMRASEAISEYQGLPRQEAFDIEYWLLEEAKLKRMPPEKEMARNVVVVIGAGSGIGKAVAHRVAKEGAHVVCADLSEETAQETADELVRDIWTWELVWRAQAFQAAALPLAWGSISQSVKASSPCLRRSYLPMAALTTSSSRPGSLSHPINRAISPMINGR